MKHSTGTPTKTEARRMDTIKELGECMCCKQRGMIGHYIEVHHLLSGNKRRGHLYTVGLCPWHHRGVPMYGYKKADMICIYGHSLAHGSKPFRRMFGSDDYLLWMQNEMLDADLCPDVESCSVGAVP